MRPPNREIRWSQKRLLDPKSTRNRAGCARSFDCVDGAGASRTFSATRSWANRWIGERVDRENLAHAMSPLSYLRSDDPAIFIVHVDRDPTVPYSQSLRLEEGLTKAGASAGL
jgi:dipeptidyl aminopeptidase/acylaminoacyl peptidase